jgi:hypothetical protein
MNLPDIVRNVKEKIQNAPDRLALTILIWLEKEPSHDRVMISPSQAETRGPYLHYSGEKNCNRRLTGKERAA